MALWDIDKIKPLINKDVASMKPIARDNCFWCQKVITDQSTEDSGNVPFWETSDGDSGCDSSSFGCQPWNDYHFHGNDGDRQVPHSEQEAEWMGEEFQPENEDKCGGAADHQSIGQVLDMVDKGLVRRDYYADSIEVSDDRRRLDEGIGTHCDEGHCHKASCHTCNPDPKCSSHKTCVNSRKCPDCSWVKATHAIDWYDDHPCEVDTTDDDYDYQHPKYAFVDDAVRNVDRLRDANLLDVTVYFIHNEEESSSEDAIHKQMQDSHYDASGDDSLPENSYSITPLQHRVCQNSYCKSYEESR